MEADYGHDANGQNDVGRNGVDPHTLAEVATAVADEVDWEKFDLNDDGWVDRFLILHCVKPQEDEAVRHAYLVSFLNG